MILTLCFTAAGAALVGLWIGQFLARCPEEERCGGIVDPEPSVTPDHQRRISDALMASVQHVVNGAATGKAPLGQMHFELLGPRGMAGLTVLVMDDRVFDQVIKPVLGDQRTIERRKL